VPLTEADKAVVGFVSGLSWSDPDLNLTGPRGLKIGDSEEKVLKSYLDLRAKYAGLVTDDPVHARYIYMHDDSKWPNGFNSRGYYSVSEDDSYAITYFCSDMSYMLEGTSYSIIDHKVVSISQRCVEGD